jgi:ketosteroid isomerase-like protein
MATNKEIVEGAYSSFAQGDIPAALGAMAEDIHWVEADGFPLAGTYVGPQTVLEGVFMRLAEIGDDFAVVPEQFVADGDAARGYPQGARAQLTPEGRGVISADSERPPSWCGLDVPLADAARCRSLLRLRSEGWWP